jgi:hypothetical protein
MISFMRWWRGVRWIRDNLEGRNITLTEKEAKEDEHYNQDSIGDGECLCDSSVCDIRGDSMKCSYCFRDLGGSTKFHGAYADHLMKENEYVPVFCDKICMLAWASVRTGKPMLDVVQDYEDFMEG